MPDVIIQVHPELETEMTDQAFNIIAGLIQQVVANAFDIVQPSDVEIIQTPVIRAKDMTPLKITVMASHIPIREDQAKDLNEGIATVLHGIANHSSSAGFFAKDDRVAIWTALPVGSWHGVHVKTLAVLD